MSDYPFRGTWHVRAPAELGMSPERLAAAVAYHREHESAWRRDFQTEGGWYIGVADEPEGLNDVLGPIRVRGGPNGVVMRSGYIVAEWGDTHRADMTFSVAKSYLALLAGVAVIRGLIRSIDDPVRHYALDAGFAAPQNRDITRRHLLTQTSEWRGTLTPEPGLGVPDTQLGSAFPNPLAPPPGCTFHPRCPEAMPDCRTVSPTPKTTAEGQIECHLYDGVQRAAS